MDLLPSSVVLLYLFWDKGAELTHSIQDVGKSKY